MNNFYYTYEDSKWVFHIDGKTETCQNVSIIFDQGKHGDVLLNHGPSEEIKKLFFSNKYKKLAKMCDLVLLEIKPHLCEMLNKCISISASKWCSKLLKETNESGTDFRGCMPKTGKPKTLAEVFEEESRAAFEAASVAFEAASKLREDAATKAYDARIQSLYERFREGESLTDDEIFALHYKFSWLERALRGTGTVFQLAYREVTRINERLQTCWTARGHAFVTLKSQHSPEVGLKWTNKSPKESGWYWVRRTVGEMENRVPRVEFIYMSSAGKPTIGKLSLATFRNLEWAGPIMPPVDEGNGSGLALKAWTGERKGEKK